MITKNFDGLSYDVLTPANFKSNDGALLFLHGFPGHSTQNHHLAYFAAARYNKMAFIPTYKGIGRSPGNFSFVNSIEDSISFLKYLSKEYSISDFILIGHSWGGNVAMNVALNAGELVKKVILLAPVTKVPEAESVLPQIETFVNQKRALNEGEVSIEDLSKELQIIREHYAVENQLQAIVSSALKIFINHGKEDSVIPYQASVDFRSKVGEQCNLTLSEDNHWFTNRPVLYDFLVEALEA